MKKKLAIQPVWFLILHGLIAFNSLGGVLSKTASIVEGEFGMLSVWFFLVYAAEIFVLFTYAIVWQQVLKHIPLTTAFCNKSVGMIWTTLWGVFLFHEEITPVMILGAAIVLVGVILVVMSRE